MSFFREMDLYKGVILASVVLLPLAGWWIQRTNEQIEVAQKAIVDGRKMVEDIGKLQRQIEIVERNKATTSQATSDPGTYFQGQIYRSAKDGAIGTNDFNVVTQAAENAKIGNQPVTDHIVKINFVKQQGGKDMLFSRDLLFAVLFNCESGARGGEGQLPSIWKLRKLEIRNEAVSSVSGSAAGTPPAELPDSWVVRDLQFARREPAGKK